MSNELKEAIELLTQPGRRLLNGQRIRLLERVAEAYFAEHPADDGEPVTDEWLMDLGFVIHHGTDPWDEYHMALPEPVLSVELFVTDDGDVGLARECDDTWVRMIFAANRGQVRRLLAALMGGQP